MPPIGNEEISRRDLIRTAAAATLMHVAAPAVAATTSQAPAPPADPVELSWLESTPTHVAGVTWGVPWPRGTLAPTTPLAIQTKAGAPVPSDSWPIAWWPDGSIKWSAHAVGPAAARIDQLRVVPATNTPNHADTPQLRVTRDGNTTLIDTGTITLRLGQNPAHLIDSITRGQTTLLQRARLLCTTQDRPDDDHDAQNSPQSPTRHHYTSEVATIDIERAGTQRLVVKLTGHHVAAGRKWLPFTVRLYLYAGSDILRLMHTFIYDGNESADFLRGLGVEFDVPMHDEPHNRHVRFVGQDSGMFAEAVLSLTGMRQDPGAEPRRQQIAGQKTADASSFDPAFGQRMHFIPTWSDFTLSQLSADGFAIRKRTKPGHGWIPAGAGARASGVGYIGGAGGGIAFGQRYFWERHPTQLDIRDAATPTARVTLWLHSPEAPPMDLRFYHDGLAQDTYEKQLDALRITYEDYEPGFGTPCGIARTNELYLQALPSTPSHADLLAFTSIVRTPPQLVCRPQRYLDARVFGALWTLPDRSHPALAKLEDEMDFLFDYYQKHTHANRWYGFWDHGDIMHTYDIDRHCWRYDVGGYAWDNSELSPDLWLWYAFLRSGRPDIYRFAEAMTRHTGEVDTYHLGKFQGLGTRHNVQHFGCSAKQLRISTAVYRRIFYYLTADERTGDLMHAQIDSDAKLLEIDATRKVRTEPYTPRADAMSIGLGTDWGSLASAWLTEWERNGQPIAKTKLLNSVTTLGKLTRGFFTEDATYDLATGLFSDPGTGKVDFSHLSAVFGQVEIVAELIDLLGDEGFTQAWLHYCRFCNASPAVQLAELGKSYTPIVLRDYHSRLTAYAAWKLKDPALAARAAEEFFQPQAGQTRPFAIDSARISQGPERLTPVVESHVVTTNDAAQFGLTAIQNIALIRQALIAQFTSHPTTAPAPKR